MTRTRKPPRDRKPVTIGAARGRVRGLTQTKLEALSGVDRTWISKLERHGHAARVAYDTYEKLDTALRNCGALKANEKLVFGIAPTEAVA